MLRTGRKGLAAATLLGDMLKGTAAVLLMRKIGGIDPALAAGFAAVLGHVFPVWLNFKGGKGVATYIGVLIAVSWPVALSFAIDLGRGCGAVALFIARRPDRERGHAGAAVDFRQRQRRLGVRHPDRPRMGHASRQHFAADGRHRAQNRQVGGKPVKLIVR